MPGILVADDHSMVRTGLILAMQLELGIKKNIYEATTCAEVMSMLRAERPAHLIIDMVFKDGNALEILPSVVSLRPDLRIMVYSMMPPDVYLPVLKKYGITRHVSKGASHEETLHEIRTFLEETIIQDKKPADAKSISSPFSRLSPREMEVLHYLLQGAPVTAISQTLNIHKNTVSTLKNRILEKTGLHNMKELFDAASAWEIIL